MRKYLLIIVTASLFIMGCNKDNNDTTTPVDQRDKFVGTWTGEYKFTLVGLPDNLSSFVPDKLPASVVITKSQASPSEIELKINNGQVAYAVITGNEYLYKPFTLTPFPGINLTLNGTGKIGSDGKSISETGNLSGSFSFGQNEGPLSGTWSSVLNKQ